MQADKTKVMRLLKTARGQLEGVMKMVQEDAYCVDIAHQILAAQAVLRKANREILLAHARRCVAQAFDASGKTAREKAEEMIGIIDKISK